MKLKVGGFGLALYQQLLPAAFLAAWVQSLKELPIDFQHSRTLGRSIFHWIQPTESRGMPSTQDE